MMIQYSGVRGRGLELRLALALVVVVVVWAGPVWGSIALVTARRRGGPEVARVVSPPFAVALREKHDLVPEGTYTEAATKLGVRPFRLQGASRVGADLGLSHVLFLEGVERIKRVGPKRKKRRVPSLRVRLVDVRARAFVFDKVYPLSKREAIEPLVSHIVAELDLVLPEGRLAVNGQPGGAADEVPTAVSKVDGGDVGASDSQEALRVEQASLGTGSQGPAAGDGGESFEGAEVTTSDRAKAAKDDGSKPESIWGESAEVAPDDWSTGWGEAAESDARAQSLPAFRAEFRGALLQRMGYIPKGDGREYVTCYCGPKGEVNPFFGSLGAQFELYPFAFAAQTGFLVGLGLDAELMWGQVNTHIASDESIEIGSQVLQGRGGLSWRLLFWDDRDAPVFRLKVGYQFLSFPLDGAAFPGMAYEAPYAGGNLSIPIGDATDFLVGGTMAYPVAVGGEAGRLGDELESGFAYHGEVGLRFDLSEWIEAFEVTALGTWDGYHTQYTGLTTLPEADQIVDAELNDRFVSLQLALGWGF